MSITLESLSNFLEIEMGQSPEAIFVNKSRDGIPLLNGPAEFTDHYPVPVQYTTGGKRFSEEGDILFCVRGSTTGRMNVSDQRYAIGRGLAAIRHKHGKHLNSFAKALLDFNLSGLLGGTLGSVFPNLTKDQLYGFKTAIPDVITQEKIARILSLLENKILCNNKLNDNLEQIAKALYEYWFVQFDFPDKNDKPYKSSGGEMVYNKILNKEIPEGWKVKPLKAFIAKDKNGDWGKELPEGNYTSKVQCVRGTDINGINGKGEAKAPVRYILEKNAGKILAPNDLIIEISGGSPVQSTGRLAYITNEVLNRFENPLICSNFCKAVSLERKNLFYYFIQSWNRAYESGVFFGFEGKTSGIKNLLFDTLARHYHISEPTDTLLANFHHKIEIIERQRQINLKQSHQLASLRDWLLPMLMNGQVRID